MTGRSLLAGVHRQMTRALRDVTRLEINTILKPALQAVTPTSSVEALRAIAHAYHRWVGRYPDGPLGYGITREQAARLVLPPADDTGFPDWCRSRGSTLSGDEPDHAEDLAAAFGTLLAVSRRLTRAILDAATPPDDGSAETPHTPANARQRDLVLLGRIERNADGLCEILRRYRQETAPPASASGRRKTAMSATPGTVEGFDRWLSTDDRLRIRKIWEIGTADIAMQTVIQIDGDVVTYVQPYYAREAHRDLHALHRQSVEASMTMWSTLIQTVSALITGLVGTVTGNRTGRGPPGPSGGE